MAGVFSRGSISVDAIRRRENVAVDSDLHVVWLVSFSEDLFPLTDVYRGRSPDWPLFAISLGIFRKYRCNLIECVV